MSDFAAVAAALRAMQDDRQAELEEAEAECRLADAALARAESSADMRTWSQEERDEWEGAHFRVRTAYDNLRKAKAAL